jgi:hypothetical protein
MAPALRMTHVTKASYKFFLQKFSVRLRSKPLLLPRIHLLSQCSKASQKLALLLIFFLLRWSVVFLIYALHSTSMRSHYFNISSYLTKKLRVMLDVVEVESIRQIRVIMNTALRTQHPRTIESYKDNRLLLSGAGQIISTSPKLLV